MPTATTVHKAVSREFASIAPDSDMQEVLVVCPNCKTMETLLWSEGHFFLNRKFSETEDGLYHNCGSKHPCRVYRSKQSSF